jgi:hypothetical protein
MPRKPLSSILYDTLIGQQGHRDMMPQLGFRQLPLTALRAGAYSKTAITPKGNLRGIVKARKFLKRKRE